MARIAVNGFGRIGRLVVRAGFKHGFFKKHELVAVNAPDKAMQMADLFTYDSVHGRWPGKVKINGPHSFTVDGTEIHTLEERDPSKLPWKKLDVDLVLDCTGAFRTKEKLQSHIDAGAGKVLLSAPPKDDMKQFVKGINDDHYQGEEIVSMASCTTNCLAPMVKVLLDDFGFKRGFMTTVHAYTNDQVVLDSSHKDL
ncbi:MAG: glyceraldehyde 3-phosphate dehydrogenase NAD-binding domain-containing protein, partial [Candidatus Micrarchaeota archaeon]